MTNKGKNAVIKKELKDAGYSIKDFSVRIKNCGYSESIHITIKSPVVNRMDISALLQHWEEIDRDERSGEILQGCNCYLIVQYDDGVFNEAAREYQATADKLLKTIEKDICLRVFDGLYLISSDQFACPQMHQQDDRGHGNVAVWGTAQLAELIYKFTEFGTIFA